ncbi:protein AKNAD1 [Glossophaga mutica]
MDEAHLSEDGTCKRQEALPYARGDLPKSNISDILQHHLSEEEFLKGEGIDRETLPEISNADSSDEAVVKSVILRYVKSSWPEEQAPELTGQPDPERDDESGAKPSGSPVATEESTSELEEPAAAGDGSHPESSNFLTQAKGPSHTQKGGQRQTPQNLQTEETGLGRGFQCDQVRHLFSDFSTVVPTGKIPENNIIDKPLPTDKQDHFSHELRDRVALVQDILESLSRSSCVEKEEQERKASDPPRETEMEPPRHIHQERPAGTEPETSLFKSTSTSQKNPPASSSYIFQRISHGKGMCQKLREQTDRLRSKVQEFSRSIAQDAPRRHVRDKRLALEKLQGRLASLEQGFVAHKEKHLTWKQQVRKQEAPAVGDFDPERKVEGEMFRLEMLLEEVKEKIGEGKHTSASSPPENSPAALADLPPTSSPPSDEVIQNLRPNSMPGKMVSVTLQSGARSILKVVRDLGFTVCKDFFAEEQLEAQEGQETSSGQMTGHNGSQLGLSPGMSHFRGHGHICVCFLVQRDPHVPSGRQKRAERAEITGRSCVFCHRVPEWRQNLEKKGYRRISCRRSPTALQEQALHSDSSLSPDTELSCYSASGTGPQSTTCETCGTKIPNSPRGCQKEPLREFHYRYNSPGQNYSNHEGGSAFVQLRFLNENKNSSPSCSKPNWIYSESANSKPSQDEHEPIPGKVEGCPQNNENGIKSLRGVLPLSVPTEEETDARQRRPSWPWEPPSEAELRSATKEPREPQQARRARLLSTHAHSQGALRRRAEGASHRCQAAFLPSRNSLKAFTAHSSDLASSSPHFHSRRISGSKSSGNRSSIEETKSEGLNWALDNALRTAIVLKETTDRMIRTIAEDLSKVQRWRNRLKY